MLFFWLIPLLALAVLATIWFARRVEVTSPAERDSDLISTDDALRERRAESELSD